MRCYTQNIDGLEAREGLCTDLNRGKGTRSRFTKKSLSLPKAPVHQSPGGGQDNGCEVVQLHGDLKSLRCTFCQKTCGWEEGGREAMLLNGKAPECFSCTLQDQGRRDRGKRGTKVGVLRPDIVLYGEEHPSADAVSTITTHDLGFAPDLLLILGTSLHVHGLKVLVREFAKSVHAKSGGKGKVVFVNLSKPSESVWKDVIDFWISMDCDEWITALKRHRPDMWHIQRDLVPPVRKANFISKPGLFKASELDVGDEKENINITAATPAKANPHRSPSSSKTPKPLLDSTKPTDTKYPIPSSIPSDKKALKRKRSIAFEQLPTPPSTCRAARFWVESREVPDSEEDMPQTPSKRSKPEIVIFQDPSPKRRCFSDGR